MSLTKGTPKSTPRSKTTLATTPSVSSAVTETVEEGGDFYVDVDSLQVMLQFEFSKSNLFQDIFSLLASMLPT